MEVSFDDHSDENTKKQNKQNEGSFTHFKTLVTLYILHRPVVSLVDILNRSVCRPNNFHTQCGRVGLAFSSCAKQFVPRESKKSIRIIQFHKRIEYQMRIVQISFLRICINFQRFLVASFFSGGFDAIL